MFDEVFFAQRYLRIWLFIFCMIQEIKFIQHTSAVIFKVYTTKDKEAIKPRSRIRHHNMRPSRTRMLSIDRQLDPGLGNSIKQIYIIQSNVLSCIKYLIIPPSVNHQHVMTQIILYYAWRSIDSGAWSFTLIIINLFQSQAQSWFLRCILILLACQKLFVVLIEWMYEP